MPAFQTLREQREPIEQEVGMPMIWRHNEGQMGTLIGIQIAGGYRANRDEWPEIHRNMVDAMMRLEAALGPRLARLR